MHPARDFWTFFLIFLSLNRSFSLTLNDTDAVGAVVRFNATAEENPTEISIKHELHIAGLFDLESRNGNGALAAAMMAVDEINQDSRFLEDYEVVLHYQRSTKVRYNFHFVFLVFRKAGGIPV